MKSKNAYVRLIDPNGKVVRKHFRYSSNAEYIRKYNEIEQNLMQYPLISDIADEWKEEHFKTINLNTQSGYIAPIKDIKEYFVDYHLDDIKPLDVSRFLAYLEKTRKYSKQTLKLRLIVLNQIYNFAQLSGLYDSNPCTPVKVNKNATVTKRENPTSDEIEKVKNSTDCFFGLYAYLLLYTGMRKGEALALRWKDIDFKNDTISVTKTIVYDGNEPIVQNHPKTDAGTRIIPLLMPLKFVLKPTKSEYIFLNQKGQILSRNEFKSHWDRYRRESGVNITAHQLRHAFATMMHENINLKDAAAILGHSDIQTTANIYQHITEEHRNEIFAELIEKIK